MKKGMLPRLAVMNIRKNRTTYLPYIGISIFALFTYFVFDLILNNEVVRTVPKAAYAFVMMTIGFGLLGFIMIPFLYYTNSFLIKRRKKELGLYSILGMEKKHIGIMMLFETIILYVVVTVSAIALGLLFSRLLFLLLLNLANLSVDASFSISGTAIWDTVKFYALISAINLLANLTQVGRANPIELMSESRKGEKDVKHVGIWSVLGALTLGIGYYLAVVSEVDSMIFMNFLLAVLLVVIGTYFLITSGSVTFLRALKKNKKLYYRADNFVTVSGMLYRMKKNAASLVNICIFATMAIITVVCTVALYLGIPDIQKFMYPYDMEVIFYGNDFLAKEDWKKGIERIAQEEGITIQEFHEYPYLELSVSVQENRFLSKDMTEDIRDQYRLRIMMLEDFNLLEGTSYELQEGDVLVYSGGPDFGMEQIELGGMTYRIREELKSSIDSPKASNNIFGMHYMAVVPDKEKLTEIAASYQVDAANSMSYRMVLNLDTGGEQVQKFAAKVEQWISGETGFASLEEYTEEKDGSVSMLGGLLFIGIFYGTIFAMCLLIIMYYKQITEGFEDQKNFEIMQKVGMSDEEVRHAIRKQILMVFFLPLLGAMLHTIIGMNMVIRLMAVLNFFRTGLVMLVMAGVCVVFALMYGICYQRTAKTYYRIVKQMQ